MWNKWSLIALLVLLAAPFVSLAIMSLCARRPEHLGVKDGKLAVCPSSPNCVSTQAEDAEHRIEPLRFVGAATEARLRLVRAIETLPRAKIVSQTEDYLHVECTSAIFRFVDDVECWIDAPNRVIHLRSASRAGHSDFGVNRSRMETIRAAFEKGA